MITIETARRAVQWAGDRHEAVGQVWGGGPYSDHLYDTIRVLERHGLRRPEVLTAAALHDVVEDTPTTIDDVRAVFGDDVAGLVDRLTSRPGRHRRERWALTAPRIRGDERAVQIKIADRIANVDCCWRTRDARLFMYRAEHLAFRRSLYLPADGARVLDMWATLDGMLGRGREG